MGVVGLAWYISGLSALLALLTSAITWAPPGPGLIAAGGTGRRCWVPLVVLDQCPDGRGGALVEYDQWHPAAGSTEPRGSVWVTPGSRVILDGDGYGMRNPGAISAPGR